MMKCIGIRRETKDKTQRRVPLSPRQVRRLIRHYDIKVLVEPWHSRVFGDQDYKKAGAILTTDLDESNIIFGVKEVAPTHMRETKAYAFFSHTIKGQRYNMQMLQAILDKKNSLFDYELVKGRDGKRLIFFGDYAGYAGMIDSLWALGRRLQWEGIRNPFSSIHYATHYHSLKEVEEGLDEVALRIKRVGLPKNLVPFCCAFTGYGHVANAAQYLFDKLPTEELEPEELHQFFADRNFSNRTLYKVRFRKPSMFAHKIRGKAFDLDEFQRHPDRYTNRFEQYVPYFTLIVNGIYWEPRFPRLLTKKFTRQLFTEERQPRLRVIGDITCDVEGSIELTVKTTESDNPVYVFNPRKGTIRDGWEGRGPVVLAVDKLPAELPKEASESFGEALLPFVPSLAAADFSKPRNALRIPEEFRDALIAHRGHLVPSFKYLKEFLSE